MNDVNRVVYTILGDPATLAAVKVTLGIVQTGVTTFLGGDVALNSTANFFNICNTGSIGAAGQTWELSATATCTDTGGAAAIIARIWDGSATTYASSPTTVAGANVNTQVSISPVVVTLSGATTFHLSMKDATLTTGVAQTSGITGAANKATWITAKRIT